MDCATFKQSLFHFQADEVSESERLAFERHLAGCAGCARRLAFEDGMLAAVRGRLRPVEPPPGLETRIRAALTEPATGGGLRSWLRAPSAVTAVAAALLLAVLVLPRGRLGAVPRSAGEAVAAQVTVVDLDCHRAGKTLAQQRACRHDKHVNALRLGDGTIWNLSLAQEAARRLALDRGLRGHELAVRGKYFSALRTVWVTETTDLGNQL